jgi:hypothetical protein
VSYRFRKHYTREEAQALLPQINRWLTELDQRRADLSEIAPELAALVADGKDAGGPLVNRWVTLLASLQVLLSQFVKRDIQLKDLDRGLLDFPSLLNGREVFLCWERDEDSIGYWHDLDAGYAGREPLPPRTSTSP